MSLAGRAGIGTRLGDVRRAGSRIVDDATRVSPSAGTVLVAVVAACLGGIAVATPAGGTFTGWLLAGVVFGLLFAFALDRRVDSPGQGLVWGVAAGVLAWAGWAVWSGGADGGAPFVESAFPALVATLLGLGATTGLAVGGWSWLQADSRSKSTTARRRRVRVPWRALVVGAGAGGVGGWVFSLWMARVGMFPLLAGALGMTDPRAGLVVHTAIAVTIGASFGLLFAGDLRGPGSALAWGLVYGLCWWLLGGLTLLPIVLGLPVDWSAALASAGLGSFVGHAVYGVVLGLSYTTADRAWVGLFHASDPLAREVPGPGFRLVRAVGVGALASTAGGLLFGVVMWVTGDVLLVARLVGSDAAWVGMAVHLAISAVVGATYVLAFRDESPDVISGLGWGVVYGVVWWLVGPLTLMPTLLGAPLAWSAAGVVAALPSLFGHLLYGAATGVSVAVLERRRRSISWFDPRVAARDRRRLRPAGTPAPAVWVVAVGIPLLVVALVL